jgi:hypothetical protein
MTLSQGTHPTEFPNFRQTGSLTFAIPRDDPSFNVGLAAITLKGVIVRIPGAKTDDNRVSLELIHRGRAEFLDTARNLLVFSHEPRATQVVYDQVSGPITDDSANLGQDGSFAGLSPFATWTVSLLKANNPGLDLSNAAEITLDFSGFFFPFNG